MAKPKSFTCKRCNQVRPFSDEVYQKWNKRLIIVCACGAKYNLFRGVVKPFVPDGPDLNP